MLGAAGGVEAIASIQSILKSQIPPTINYETPDEQCDLDYTPNILCNQMIRIALSDSLGFGGHNAAVIVSKFEN